MTEIWGTSDFTADHQFQRQEIESEPGFESHHWDFLLQDCGQVD